MGQLVQSPAGFFHLILHVGQIDLQHHDLLVVIADLIVLLAGAFQNLPDLMVNIGEVPVHDLQNLLLGGLVLGPADKGENYKPPPY